LTFSRKIDNLVLLNKDIFAYENPSSPWRFEVMSN